MGPWEGISCTTQPRPSQGLLTGPGRCHRHHPQSRDPHLSAVGSRVSQGREPLAALGRKAPLGSGIPDPGCLSGDSCHRHPQRHHHRCHAGQRWAPWDSCQLHFLFLRQINEIRLDPKKGQVRTGSEQHGSGLAPEREPTPAMQVAL